MNYWFLYTIVTGEIYGSPYLGNTDEWTNIPEGCGVIGPVPQNDVTASDAFTNPDCYTVQNGKLTPLPNFADIKSKKQADAQKSASTPTLEQRLAALESAQLSQMGL